MNLQEFIEYRKTCPLCGNALRTILNQRKQSCRFETDRLVFLFHVDGLKKKGIVYKVGYSFSLKNNNWCIEFYNKDDVRFEKDTPLFLMERFKELNANLLDYRIWRECAKMHYRLSSNLFELDFRHATMDFLVSQEKFCFQQLQSDGLYKISELHNDYEGHSSSLSFRKSPSSSAFLSDYLMFLSHHTDVEVPLVPFTSKEETVARINKLLIFS